MASRNNAAHTLRQRNISLLAENVNRAIGQPVLRIHLERAREGIPSLTTYRAAGRRYSSWSLVSFCVAVDA